MTEVKPPRGEIVEVSLPAAPQMARKAMKDLTPEERKEYNRNAQAKKRSKDHTQVEKSLRKANSNDEVSRKESRDILAERGVVNHHVMDVLFDLAETAARQNNLPLNDHFLRHGLRATQAVLAKADLPAAIENCDVPGELINSVSLYAIWDYSDFSQFETPVTYEAFQEIRLSCKRDCFYLGKQILNKDFAECHRVWSHEFFPQFDPTTLQPGYTQKQMIQWLDSQSVKKDFLLMASRNSFKSSWSHVWLLTLILCMPDIRVLLVSETRPLSKDFIGAIRSYFEVATNQETRFQKLFPEYTIPLGDGSVLSLDCPMAHLRLPQSIESTSMDSAVAGRRADILIFDDPISNNSCGNEVQCAASVTKYDALRKLREVGGLVVVLGTPWRDEIDLYATLLKRNQDDEDEPLAFRIDPAWTLKPEFTLLEGKPRPLREIEEHMVTLLFPERLTWKFLRSELRANVQFFASQNLCIFPRDADADIRCTFDEIVLREHVKPASFFSTDLVSKTVLSIDTAFSTAATADYSCLTTIKILKHDGKDCAVVWDVDLGRWPYTDLAIHIVQAIDKHRPNSVVIEKDRTWQNLQRAISQQAAIRGVVLPHIYWREPASGGAAPMQKSRRVKALEPLVSNDQLWFVSAHWTDECITQTCKFNGITKSSASRKDDFIDCLAIGIQTYFPYNEGIKVFEKTEEQKQFEKAELEDRKRREIYKNYFGNQAPPRVFTPEIEEPNDSPLFRGQGAFLRRK